VDVDKWNNLDWQILIPNPSDIAKSSRVYPRTEQAPSVALSLMLDRRDNAIDPHSGYALFLEGRRTFVNNLGTNYRFNFNQVTGEAWGYLSPFAGQTIANHAEAIVRDHFDPDNLGHRLISYNDQFRGFSSLFGTNLLFWNLEYRVHLFGIDMKDVMQDMPLSPKTQKLLNKFSYSAEALAFMDNGVFFGRVYDPLAHDIAFQDIRLSRDLYTSVGLGGRLIYPKLGYTISGGVVLYQHKEGLPSDCTSRIYGSVGVCF
jgi:outer membrane protein assembly factor BamA